ncbi:DNA primase, partial [Patescibacteria group bacterium]|nr:DNA primase [Patescibacteria group bacterium]MBU1448699.1 DNA primase [Patescibacteria group bacterium]
MEPVEEVKSRLDIVDVVQEYLPMKPAGSGSFKGLCPFHHEKTPSFYANRPRQSWHCFGCDIGGDVISFVMKMEGMEFREALELLAQKTGVELPAFDPTKTTERKRMHEVNDLAARWFRAILLKDPRAEAARAYVAKRGIDGLTGDLWRIGYAPDGWTNLTDALKEKSVTEEELLKTGLVGRSERGSIYDRFRDRLMFTICDVHGNPVGFTGRILDTPPPVIPTEAQRSGGIPSSEKRQ